MQFVVLSLSLHHTILEGGIRCSEDSPPCSEFMFMSLDETLVKKKWHFSSWNEELPPNVSKQKISHPLKTWWTECSCAPVAIEKYNPENRFYIGARTWNKKPPLKAQWSSMLATKKSWWNVFGLSRAYASITQGNSSRHWHTSETWTSFCYKEQQPHNRTLVNHQ